MCAPHYPIRGLYRGVVVVVVIAVVAFNLIADLFLRFHRVRHAASKPHAIMLGLQPPAWAIIFCCHRRRCCFRLERRCWEEESAKRREGKRGAKEAKEAKEAGWGGRARGRRRSRPATLSRAGGGPLRCPPLRTGVQHAACSVQRAACSGSCLTCRTVALFTLFRQHHVRPPGVRTRTTVTVPYAVRVSVRVSVRVGVGVGVGVSVSVSVCVHDPRNISMVGWCSLQLQTENPREISTRMRCSRVHTRVPNGERALGGWAVHTGPNWSSTVRRVCTHSLFLRSATGEILLAPALGWAQPREDWICRGHACYQVHAVPCCAPAAVVVRRGSHSLDFVVI